MPEEKEVKKVVLRPHEGKSVNPSQVTRVSEPVGASEEITDPMSMRDTETGSLKRMDAQDQSNSGSNQARRTIKLKPLKSPSVPDNVEETLSMERSELEDSGEFSSQVMMADGDNDVTRKVPRPKAAGSPPPPNDQTAKVPKQAAVETVEAPVEGEDDQTIKMPKPQPTQAVPAQGAPSVPGAKQTIKLRPSSSGPADATAATPAATSAKPTIKLKPKDATAEAPSSDNEEQTVAMAKQTIRLVPQSPEEQETPTTAVPTTKKKEPKPSDPTVKLTASVKPDSVTQKAPAAQAPAAKDTGAAKPKLQLRRPGEDDAAPAEAETAEKTASRPGAKPREDSDATGAVSAGKDEPNIIFALIAILSMFVLGYLGFVMFAQFGNQWQDMDLNVPGVERIK